MQYDNMLEAALRYAELGYPVFPCLSGTKKPPSKGGFHNATTDAEQIKRWWAERPSANIGIATAGLLVLDIEQEAVWLNDDAEKQLELAVAPLASTAGGGRHYIFRRPEGREWRNTTCGLAPHVDTRTDGGYFVAPPSALPGQKNYGWVKDMELDIPAASLPKPPAWLIEQLDVLATGGLTSDRVAAGEAEANKIPDGQRNATLARLGGNMRRVGMSQAEILAALIRTNTDRCDPPLDEREVEQIAASIARYEPDQVSVAVAENHWEQMHEEQEHADRPGDPGPFPADLLVVPGFVAAVMDHNLRTAFKRQPVLALGSAIALLGTLTGRKIADEYGTRTNLYCLGVCNTGGGKEHGRQVNKDILYLAGLDKMNGPEGIASHAGLISAVEQQPAILFQLDEMGRMLRTLGDASRAPHLFHIATVLMRLFSSAGTVYKSDAYSDAKHNKTIYQPHACLYGTTVARSLYEGLTAESLTDGFVSRLLVFESNDPDPEPQHVPKCEPPAHIIDIARYWGEFQPGGNLANENPKQQIAPYSNVARQVMIDLEHHARQERRQASETIAALWTRTTEKARKLALIHACSANHERPEVDEVSATWGAAVSEYLTRKLISIAAEWVSENPFEAKRKRVLRLISKAGVEGMSRTQLYRKTKYLQTKERADILESLESTGEIRLERLATSGAPRVTYRAY
jgi:hypothetical protein